MIDPEAFLKQEVESATPAKLRWLLLQKGVGLVDVIADLWRNDQEFEARQWVIRVRDIFSELLQGVVDRSNEIAQTQTDLYVFLSKLLTHADQTRNLKELGDIREILEIEMKSWEMFVRQEQRGAISPQSLPDSANYASLDLMV